MIALICLALAIVAYAIAQLQQHGQLKWMSERKPFRFWGSHSYQRKYKELSSDKGPAFPLSTTLFIFLTDGYHFMQFWMFNFLALSLTFAHGWNWWLFGAIMVFIRIIHWAARYLLSKSKA